jgi:hypothetical protein
MERFNKFLADEEIKLLPHQMEVAEHMFNDPIIVRFLFTLGTGKSYLFKVLESFAKRG